MLELRVQRGGDDEHGGVPVRRAVLDLFSKRPADQRLVGDDQDPVSAVAGAPADRRASRLLVAPYQEECEDHAQDQAARDRQADAGPEQDGGQDHRRDQDGDGDREPEGVFFGTEWVDHAPPSLPSSCYRM